MLKYQEYEQVLLSDIGNQNNSNKTKESKLSIELGRSIRIKTSVQTIARSLKTNYANDIIQKRASTNRSY